MNTSASRPLDYYLLWLVALTSLAVNVWLIRTLLVVRYQAGEAAGRMAQEVAKLSQSSIDYTITVKKDVPLSLVVPISTTVTVPIHASIPIDTQVTVPLQTPFGEIPVTLPVQTTIPVNLETEAPVNASVPISTIIPVLLDVPVHLSLADTSLGESLQSAQAYLEKLATTLQTSPFQFK
jgi:hypothetical protein